MTTRKTLSIIAVMLFQMTVPSLVPAEEGAEPFILPETPPTIEKAKKPPLDRPFLRKNNFVPEFDLSPADVPVRLVFHEFGIEGKPVEAGISQGSFSSRAGYFIYASTKSVSAACGISSTAGEHPNLAGEANYFSLGLDKNISDDRYFKAGARHAEKFIWLEQKKFYDLGAEYGWYARRNINIKARASYEKGEVTGQDSNDSVSARLAVNWQPFEGQSAGLLMDRVKDTSIGAEKVYNSASLRYDMMLFSKVVIGGGARCAYDKVFPQGNLSVGLLPGLKIRVNYLPGIEKINWNELYSDGKYAAVNKNIAHPESEYSFTENISYYVDSSNFIEFEASQARWKSYLYWESAAGSAFISPANMNDVYVPSLKARAAFGGKKLLFGFDAERNLNEELPFVPDQKFSARADVKAGPWTFGTRYEYSGTYYCVPSGALKISSYGSLSASVSLNIDDSIGLFVSGEDLSKDLIETQPGFARDEPSFHAGVKLKI